MKFNEKLLDRLIEHTSDIIIKLTKDYEVIYLNSSALSFYQVNSHSIIGSNFIEFCRKKGCPCPVTISEKTVSNHTWEVYDDIEEDITVLHGVICNAQNNAHQLLQVVACTPGSLYWKDMNGVYLGCNDSMLEVAGLKKQSDIIGKSDKDLWPENETNIVENDRYVIRTGKTLKTKETVRIQDGTEMCFASEKMPLRDDTGEIIGVIGNSLDITELEFTKRELASAKEQAEIANQAKSDFIANMSHDLRTPLAGIIGVADKLRDSSSDIQDIYHSSRVLLDLLNQIVEISKITSNKKHREEQSFSFKELLDDLETLLLPSVHYKGLNLETHVSSNIHSCYLGDKHRIHRIILNLVGNSIKFTTAGFIKIDVTLDKVVEDKEFIKIQIQDTGVGIPKDKIDNIFSRFERLSPSYQGIYDGAGLGLSIVKEYINDISGEIHVTSEIDRGSVFTCLIPLKISTSQTNMTKSSAEETHKLIRSNPNSYINIFNTILLVEDNLLAQKAASYILEKFKCRIDLANNGTNAIKLAKENTYDLILLDIGLPDIDGLNVAKLIRDLEREANAPRTPIFALTAHVNDKYKQHCLQEGIDTVLFKPLEANHLESIIQKFNAIKNNKQLSSIMKIDHMNRQDDKVIDLTLGAKLAGGDHEQAKILLDEFVKDLPFIRSKLEESIAASDISTVKKQIHLIHASLCYIGAPKLKSAIHDLEVCLSKEKNIQNKMIFNKVIREMDKLISTYQANLEECRTWSS